MFHRDIALYVPNIRALLSCDDVQSLPCALDPIGYRQFL